MSSAQIRPVRSPVSLNAGYFIVTIGTLTKNEQQVTEVYTIDETITVDSVTVQTYISPALRKALQIGCLCNNAHRNEGGEFVGQATDIALLNVLNTFWMSDIRDVRIREQKCGGLQLSDFRLSELSPFP